MAEYWTLWVISYSVDESGACSGPGAGFIYLRPAIISNTAAPNQLWYRMPHTCLNMVLVIIKAHIFQIQSLKQLNLPLGNDAPGKAGQDNATRGGLDAQSGTARPLRTRPADWFLMPVSGPKPRISLSLRESFKSILLPYLVPIKQFHVLFENREKAYAVSSCSYTFLFLTLLT